MAKASKRRHCPALGREITPVDCGEDRNRRITCPADCAFNPFNPANYDQLIEIEDRLDHKTMGWLADDAIDRSALQRETEAVLASESGHAMHAYMVGKIFFRRDATGLTCAQRWAKSGYAGLRNDERALFAAKAQMRVTALEIRRVIDDQFLEAVDLLEPERGRLLMLDRSLAARAVRFAVLIGWTFPLPHFWRLSGTAIMVPDMGGPAPEEIVVETLRHLGAPTDDAEARSRWLVENFLRIDASMTATALERRRLMLEGIDAEWCEATYTVVGQSADFRQRLVAEPAVDADELGDSERAAGFNEAWAWFDDAKAADLATPPGGRQLLGSIVLGKGLCRIQAMGRARYENLRRLFEARLGACVKFTAERRENKGVQLAGKSKAADPALVPASLLENPMKLSLASSRIPGPRAGETFQEVQTRLMEETLRRFLDDAIPALDGRTPRQAVLEPQLRVKLVRLLKARVRQLDEENLRTGRSDDINWLIRELGLAEIDIPAPPPRDPPEQDEDEGMDLDTADVPADWSERSERNPFGDGADAGSWRAGLSPARLRPPGARGPLPGGTAAGLSFDECHERLNAVYARFDGPAAAAAALDASGSELVEDLAALTAELVDENHLGLLVVNLVPAWFALVPVGAPAPVLDYDRMENAFDAELEELPRAAAGGPEAVFARVLAGCGQPMLLQIAMGQMQEMVDELPKKQRPPEQARLAMTIALKVVIAELDRVLRE